MGQSPAESSVNAGPVVYISPSGPSPIMVQPFPIQTNSLFSGSHSPSNPLTVGPVGIGNAPRHINIHIYADTILAPVVSAVGNRTSNGEGLQEGHGNNAGSGLMRVLPVQNIIAAAGPTHATGAVSSAAQSAPSHHYPLLLLKSIQDLETLLVTCKERTRLLQVMMLVLDSPIIWLLVELRILVLHYRQTFKLKKKSHNLDMLKEVTISQRVVRVQMMYKQAQLDALQVQVENPRYHCGQRRVKQTKSSLSTSDSGTTSSSLDQNMSARMTGQQILQSLASQSSSMNRVERDACLSNPGVQSSRLSGVQSSDDQLDAANAVSQVLQSPALNGLLAGVSEQTGVGLPNVFRNMLQQLTQSPQIMNTVSQLAHQVDGQDIGNMFSGLGGGQGGGIGLSRMVQQMMPIVSQALTRGASAPSPFSTVESKSQVQHEGRKSSAADKSCDPDFQVFFWILFNKRLRGLSNLICPVMSSMLLLKMQFTYMALRGMLQNF